MRSLSLSLSLALALAFALALALSLSLSLSLSPFLARDRLANATLPPVKCYQGAPSKPLGEAEAEERGESEQDEGEAPQGDREAYQRWHQGVERASP